MGNNWDSMDRQKKQLWLAEEYVSLYNKMVKEKANLKAWEVSAVFGYLYSTEWAYFGKQGENNYDYKYEILKDVKRKCGIKATEKTLALNLDSYINFKNDKYDICVVKEKIGYEDLINEFLEIYGTTKNQDAAAMILGSIYKESLNEQIKKELAADIKKKKGCRELKTSWFKSGQTVYDWLVNKNFKNFRVEKNQNMAWKEKVEYIKRKETDKKYPLNQILYGPPGTGKTYNSVIYAVAICDNLDVEKLKTKITNNEIAYKAVFERYKELKDLKRIEFVTFHQSYGYEEFIQGIKPYTTSKGQIEYKVENGIFKEFCEEPIVTPSTTSATGNDEKFDEAWEKLINNIKAKDNQLTIALQTKQRELRWDEEKNKFYVVDHKTKTQFVNYDIVKSVYDGTFVIKQGSGTNVVKFTTAKGIIDILENVFGLEKLVRDENLGSEKKEENKVFIIDEINRGNVSKIFGELITLIEESKRVGKDEGMEVRLPYKDDDGEDVYFGVPQNVYILGTMNTADRSLVQLDAALRRRFRFIEMMPVDAILGEIKEGVNLAELLKKINERITNLIDREHQIGHSYFTKVKDLRDLVEAFKYEIIPLLQEYFYEDYAGISEVLNSQIIKVEENKKTYTINLPKDEDLSGDLSTYKEMFTKIYDDNTKK